MNGDHASGSRRPVTFVTAFYPGPAKHPLDAYLSWAERLFRSVPGRLVCFVPDPPVQQRLQRLDAAGQVEFVVLPFPALPAHGYVDDWQAQIASDPERHIHGSSEHLYIVWASKSALAAGVARTQPDDRPTFWIDLGYVRSAATERSLRGAARRLGALAAGDERMHLLGVVPFSPEDLRTARSARPDQFRGQVRLGGGMFGGRPAAWAGWAPRYADSVTTFARAGQFVGKEQNVMAALVLRDPSLATVWAASGRFRDPWFSLPRVIGRRRHTG